MAPSRPMVDGLIKTEERIMTDCKHTELSLLSRGFGAKQQNEIRCWCGLTWKISAKANRLVTGDPEVTCYVSPGTSQVTHNPLRDIIS